MDLYDIIKDTQEKLNRVYYDSGKNINVFEMFNTYRLKHIENNGYISLKYIINKDGIDVYLLKIKMRDNEIIRKIREDLGLYPERLYKLNL